MIILSLLYRFTENGVKQVNPLGLAKWVTANASELAKIGYTHILWPPIQQSQGRQADNADGYGKQFDGIYCPNRWADTDAELLEAMNAVVKAGMVNLVDLVLHQYDGGSGGFYPEANYQKTPSCFWGYDATGKTLPGRVAPDAVFDPEGNQAFGDGASYVNSLPKNYMRDIAVRATTAMLNKFPIGGFRLDDTKGMNVGFIRHLVQQCNLVRPLFWFGECFTGNPTELNRAVNEMGISTLDFTFHFNAQAICNNGASFRGWDGIGYAAWNPMRAVTFADNADTDQSPGESIISNKLWPYVVGLLGQGAMAVYLRDRQTGPNCYGLTAPINNLIWISKKLAFGAMETRYVDDDCFVFTRDGNGGEFGWSGGLLVGICRDTINGRTEEVQTMWRNTRIHDYTGHTQWDIWTDSQGRAMITIPPNVNGSAKSYVCFGTAGVE